MRPRVCAIRAVQVRFRYALSGPHARFGGGRSRDTTGSSYLYRQRSGAWRQECPGRNPAISGNSRPGAMRTDGRLLQCGVTGVCAAPAMGRIAPITLSANGKKNTGNTKRSQFIQ